MSADRLVSFAAHRYGDESMMGYGLTGFGRRIWMLGGLLLPRQPGDA
jgi:hypothetical protein